MNSFSFKSPSSIASNYESVSGSDKDPYGDKQLLDMFDLLLLQGGTLSIKVLGKDIWHSISVLTTASTLDKYKQETRPGVTAYSKGVKKYLLIDDNLCFNIGSILVSPNIRSITHTIQPIIQLDSLTLHLADDCKTVESATFEHRHIHGADRWDLDVYTWKFTPLAEDIAKKPINNLQEAFAKLIEEGGKLTINDLEYRMEMPVEEVDKVSSSVTVQGASASTMKADLPLYVNGIKAFTPELRDGTFMYNRTAECVTLFAGSIIDALNIGIKVVGDTIEWNYKGWDSIYKTDAPYNWSYTPL